MTATEQLSASREKIRLALAPVGASAGAPHQPRHEPSAAGASAPLLLGLAGSVLWQASTTLLAPLAQRHPYRLVAGAAALGAGLVVVRPWRWSGAALWWAATRPQLLAAAMAHLAPPR